MLDAKSAGWLTVWPMFTDVSRLCSNPMCSEPASFTLSFEYRQARVWIDHLAGERNPHSYDLCGRHTRGLTVPRGWQSTDRRGQGALSIPA